MTWDQKRRMPSDYIDPHKAARILAAHGHVCHLCGHEGGVLNVDHDLALGTPTRGHPTHGHPLHMTPTSTHWGCHRIASHHRVALGEAHLSKGGLPPPPKGYGATRLADAGLRAASGCFFEKPWRNS